VTQSPSVSVIIPCRNEEAFIDACLASARAAEFPRRSFEILVVDGMSSDRTRAIVQAHAADDAAVVLLDNPAGHVPAAMNIGLRRAQGEIIVRLDAHARYPADYIPQLIGWLDRSGADNVGGVCVTRPGSDTARAAAIAFALAHPFGVGNSHFRIGVREPRWVDTVPFGCYRREVFDRIGPFDEDLVRNQDDELNARLIRKGGRILLVPDVVSEYFARESFGKLWTMYYQYGYFKPLVARKLGAVMTVRQLLPATLVSALAGGAILAVVFPMARAPFAALLAAYAAADVASAAWSLRTGGIARALWLVATFPILHVAYGLGFLKGLADFVILNRAPGARVRAVVPSR
jgi:glycosyltransferase involved in cell wall biosynthesis